MKKYKFEIRVLEPADEFLSLIDVRAKRKILDNIERVKFNLDPKFFKKLDSIIWEFRTEHNRIQYRLLAFWDKRGGETTLVVATHGFIKKQTRLLAKKLIGRM